MSEMRDLSAQPAFKDGTFVFLLIRWVRRWRAIAVVVGCATVTAGFLAFFGTKQYDAMMTVQVQGGKKSASALLSSLGAGDMASLIGTNVNSNVGAVMSLAQSRILADRMIQEYRLDTVWKFKPDWKFEDGYKAWNKRFSIASDDWNVDALVFSYEDHDRRRAAHVVQSAVNWIDSTFNAMQMMQARRNADFINGRISIKMRQLDSSEMVLRSFLKQEKVIAPNERIVLTAKKVAELEAQREFLDLEAATVVRTKGPQSSDLALLQEQKRHIETKIKGLTDEGPSSWTTAPVSRDVERSFTYERKLKDVERHSLVLKYLIQQQEMYQMDAAKDVPCLFVVDPVRVPEKKSAPRVMLIVELVFAVSLTLSLALVAVEAELRALLALLFREAFGRR